MQISKNVIGLIKISEAIKFENLVFHPLILKTNRVQLFETLDDLFDEKSSAFVKTLPCPFLSF